MVVVQWGLRVPGWVQVLGMQMVSVQATALQHLAIIPIPMASVHLGLWEAKVSLECTVGNSNSKELVPAPVALATVLAVVPMAITMQMQMHMQMATLALVSAMAMHWRVRVWVRSQVLPRHARTRWP